jgi:hypothetical protein
MCKINWAVEAIADKMLNNISTIASIVFNLTSSFAIVASAWWFYNRGSLRANLAHDLHFTLLGPVNDQEKMEVCLDVQNLGFRDAWLRQTVIAIDYVDRFALPLGPLPPLPDQATELYSIQDEYLAIVPNAKVPFRSIARAPSLQEVAIVRHFQFPGKKQLIIKNTVELREALTAAGDNYFFNETIVDLARPHS